VVELPRITLVVSRWTGNVKRVIDEVKCVMDEVKRVMDVGDLFIFISLRAFSGYRQTQT
jgi:hypothetical protein